MAEIKQLSHDNKRILQTNTKEVQDYAWLGGKGNPVGIVQKMEI